MPTPDAHSSVILSARALVKRYGTTTALDGVDLAISAGQSLAIMGPSGCGKTTLLHTLAGIITPDDGAVILAGAAGDADIARMTDGQRTELRRTRFGFVFQQAMLIPELTAIENVALPAMLSGASRDQAMSSAAGWLRSFGLEGMEARRIGELSGGQAQRVAIARAQMLRADVVFADEPTGALDSHTSAETMRLLQDSTVGDGRTLVLVTHDDTVAAQCDHVIHMRDGRIVEHATAAPARAASTGTAR